MTRNEFRATITVNDLRAALDAARPEPCGECDDTGDADLDAALAEAWPLDAARQERS